MDFSIFFSNPYVISVIVAAVAWGVMTFFYRKELNLSSLAVGLFVIFCPVINTIVAGISCVLFVVWLMTDAERIVLWKGKK